MPLPLLPLFALSFGSWVGWIARRASRGSSQGGLVSPALWATGLYMGLVVVPASLGLHLTYGDWSLLYILPASRLPSAVTLLWLILVVTLGLWAVFFVARAAQRARAWMARVLCAAPFLLGGLLVAIFRTRLGAVGTYAQLKGSYGVMALQETSLGTLLALSSTAVVAGAGLTLWMSYRHLRRL